MIAMNSTEALERTRAVIRHQHKTLATEQTYLHWLRHYIAALGKLPKTFTSEQKLEHFLTELAVRKNVAAATQNQAFKAILFLYKDVLGQPLKAVDALRATRPERVRHAPTVAETRALIAAVQPVAGYPTNLVTRLLYGCGLRVSEPLNLRVKDVCFDDGKLFIVGGQRAEPGAGTDGGICEALQRAAGQGRRHHGGGAQTGADHLGADRERATLR